MQESLAGLLPIVVKVSLEIIPMIIDISIRAC